MIESLTDFALFQRRRQAAWEANVEYWSNGPLRHVDDVGGYIVERTIALCQNVSDHIPLVLDMGFGNGWLLDALLKKRTSLSYVGVDNVQAFIRRATETYRSVERVQFFEADLETDISLPVLADVVVNAFNFFELADLPRAMRNVVKHLRHGATLIMSTIQTAYLLLAVSNTWEEFHTNLRRYEMLPGIKYAFQKIDLGSGVSSTLEYPSVFYSLQDYIDAGRSVGLEPCAYTEHAYTAKAVPKVYYHLEFEYRRCAGPRGEGS